MRFMAGKPTRNRVTDADDRCLQTDCKQQSRCSFLPKFEKCLTGWNSLNIRLFKRGQDSSVGRTTDS